MSLLSFSTLRPLRDFIFLPSPTDGEYNALLAILLLKQPLAESFWVFNNPVKIPSVDTSSSSRTQRVLFLFCACLHTDSMPSWQSFSSTERSTVLSPCAPMHLLNALLAELSESSVILVLL
jgi:hypothetical protein